MTTAPATVPATAAGSPQQSQQTPGTGRPTVWSAAPTLWVGFAAIAALGLALRLPVATTVLGLALFGVLHNVLELRYVAGRFDNILTGSFLRLLVALITGVLICRLLPPSTATRAAEIGLCYSLLGVACIRAWRHTPRWLMAAAFILIVAAIASLAFPAYHFVVLTHLHNLVPLFFLWEWSHGMVRGRTAFRIANVGWVLVIPALLLVGAFDGLLRTAPAALAGFGGVGSFDPGRLAVAYTPPAMATTDIALRFLAVFAFMQTMHYVVWIGVLPRFAPDASARFDQRMPALKGGRAWLLGIGLAAVFGLLFALDYANGKALYAAVASYHAYLEFPVLLALILGYKGERR